LFYSSSLCLAALLRGRIHHFKLFLSLFSLSCRRVAGRISARRSYLFYYFFPLVYSCNLLCISTNKKMKNRSRIYFPAHGVFWIIPVHNVLEDIDVVGGGYYYSRGTVRLLSASSHSTLYSCSTSPLHLPTSHHPSPFFQADADTPARRINLVWCGKQTLEE